MNDKTVDPISTQAISSTGAVEIANGTLSDLGQFCTRNPEICSKSRDFAIAFGAKVAFLAQEFSGFLSERLGPDGQPENGEKAKTLSNNSAGQS